MGAGCLKTIGDKGFRVGFVVSWFLTESSVAKYTWLHKIVFFHVNHGWWYSISHADFIFICWVGAHKRLHSFILGFRKYGNITSDEFLDEEVCHVHHGSPGPGETVVVTCLTDGPTHARYIYIYLPGDGQILSLCEVEVYEFTGM